MKKTLVLVAFFALSIFAEDEVKFYEASYDCSKTKKDTVEWKVCTNQALSILDKDINIIYKIIKREFNSPNLKKEQRLWLKDKNKCKNKECIETLYKIRIKELINYIGLDNKIDDDLWDMHFKAPKGHETASFDIYKIKNIYLLEMFNFTTDIEVIKLFPTNKEFKLSVNETNNLFKYMRDMYVRTSKKIIFSDGSSVSRLQDMRGGGNCSPLFDSSHHFVLKDKDNNILSERYLLELVDNPVKRKSEGYCETEDFNGFMTQRIIVQGASIYPFGSDGFISKVRSNEIIRFDKNLNTKSKLMNTRLFWMDVSEYKKLRAKYKFYTIKDENELVYKWLKNKIEDK